MQTRTKTEPPDASVGRSVEENSADPPSDEAPSPPSEPDRTGHRVGHFIVREKLGQGGMGVVYAAEDTRLHRRVALKVLPAAVTQNPERRRRFLREARAASAVAHPTIATIYEVGEDGDDVFLAMELVLGRTLRDILKERGAPFEIPDALRIAREIAEGLGKAHDAGVIHRDLKLDNVMLGADGITVKILDFGLAKQNNPLGGGAVDPTARTVSAAEFATIEGRILGTPGYMSPEQSKGKPVDVRTDIFAFGVVLFELLTGERPFRGSTAVEVLIAVDRDPHEPPSIKNPRVPPELDRVVARCLEKRPDDRFPSCRELLDALSDAPEGARSGGHEASIPEALVTSGPNRRRSRLKLVLALALALGAAGLLLGLAALVIARPKGPAITASIHLAIPAIPTSSAAASASAGAVPSGSPAAPPRRPCLVGEPGRKKCDRKEAIPWCDLRGDGIACCGRGLIPIGTDGICGCAPGGTSVSEAVAAGCSKPQKDFEEAYASVRAIAAEKAIACFHPYYQAGKTSDGVFEANFSLTPEGHVIGARVKLSTMPHEEAQSCAIAALREARFPPPRAEDVGQVLGFGFIFDTAGGADKKK